MKELLEVIAKNLVEHPEQVQVSEKEGERAWILELKLPLKIWARSSASRAELQKQSVLW